MNYFVQPTSLKRKLFSSLVIAGCVVLISGCSSGTKDSAKPTTVAAPDLSAVKTFGKQTQNHVEGTVAYPQSPPIGGDHNAAWQNCGAYAEVVPNELAVHSIEHGAVWIAYRPDLAAANIQRLQDFAVGQTHILVSPYVGLPSPIVLTAWTVQLGVDGIDDPRIAAFIEKFQEGPQTPELGAVCSGAIGTPL